MQKYTQSETIAIMCMVHIPISSICALDISNVKLSFGHNFVQRYGYTHIKSGNNIFDLTKAVAFFHEEDAHTYLNTYISRRCPTAFVAPIRTEKDMTPYVDAVDILKAGYGRYIEDMLDALPMPSQELH